MANVGAGVLQGMPVSTSLSASSLNESAGARTPMASLITGALVLLTLLFLAPLFSDLPKAVLGAVIIDAVVFGMIDVAELRRLRRVARFDFWIAARRSSACSRSGVLAGVVVGVVLSLGWLISVATTPADPAAGPRARHAGVPRPRRAPAATRRSPASSSSAWTAACSSPPRRRSRTASATLADDGSEPQRGRPRPRGRQLHRLAGRRRSSLRSTSSWCAHDATLRLARVKPLELARDAGARRPARADRR